MTRTKIRPYDDADLEAVVAIFRSNIPKYFGPAEESGLRYFLNNYPDDYYVLELGDEVIGAGGIALNRTEPPTVSLCWGMVRKDHLGRGFGKRLTAFRTQLASEKYAGVPLVISTSQHTQGFYEKLGFRVTRHVPDGFGPGIDICEMRREQQQ